MVTREVDAMYLFTDLNLALNYVQCVFIKLNDLAIYRMQAIFSL
jgi:hypothetical protein